MTTSGISSARSRLSALVALLLLLAPSAYAWADQPDLTIFFSSDTRGMLRRCGCSEGQMGGLSARASYIKANAVPGGTLVVDAGDTLFEDVECDPRKVEFFSIKARAIFESMKAAGYDAAAVGEYDLSCGWEFLDKAARDSGLKLVGENVLVGRGKKARRPFAGIVTKKFKGFRVGVVGVVDSDFPCGSFKCYTGLSLGDTGRYTREAVRAASKKADLVVVLAHLSIADPVAFTRALPGEAVVIQGHSQEVLDKPVAAGDSLLVKGFYKGKRIGRLDLWFTPGRRKRIKDYKYTVINLDESIPPDGTVEGIIARYREKLKEKEFDFVRPDPAGMGSYVGAEACRGCHRTAYANWSATGHARAFASLEKTGDQYDPECLLCHTTGFGWASGYGPGRKQGGLGEVGCECCHGRDESHAKSGGTIKKEVPERTCMGCHDEYNSPNFDYTRYLGMGGAHRGR